MSASLVICKISSSCLASVPLEESWEQLRDFGNADWASGVDLSGQFIPVTSYMLVRPAEHVKDCGCDFLSPAPSNLAAQEAVPGSTVGAHRHLDVGHGAMVERLVSMSDYEHSM